MAERETDAACYQGAEQDAAAQATRNQADCEPKLSAPRVFGCEYPCSGRLRSKAKDSSGLIFLGPAGKRMDPDYFDEFVFRRIAAKAGLPGVRFHDLRHFFASMLIAQGESAKYVCDQMGHSSIQVTFDTYGHLFPNSRETAAKKLQQAMFTGRKERTGSSLVAKPRKRGRKTEPREDGE